MRLGLIELLKTDPEKVAESFGGWASWVELDKTHPATILDGEFTAKELRAIADYLDRHGGAD